MHKITDEEIKAFQRRIKQGKTTVSDVDIMLNLIKQCINEATGNATLQREQ